MTNKVNKNNIILNYLFLLVPFIIYSIYKNGYLLYENNLITFVNIFKPLYFILLSIIITLVIYFIKYKKIELSFNLLNMIILAMIVSPRTNYIVFSIFCNVHFDKNF